MIAPFEWQHVFIPLLPGALLGYACAPMPFVIGVPSVLLDEAAALALALAAAAARARGARAPALPSFLPPPRQCRRRRRRGALPP